MPRFAARTNMLRTRAGHDHHKVTFVELFFDLVFVFAVTQISHVLLQHLTLAGLGQATFLFLAVWWVWIFTSWVTNWVDPEKIPVRVMLFVLMLAGLVLTTSLPDAFGSRGLIFAIAFATMQLGRSLFMLWALRHHHPGNFRNFQRISAWLGLSALLWIAGGLSAGDQRVAFWIAALGIEYLSPSVGFWTPGLGRSDTRDWNVEGGHMAERCALFVIIALGESILVTGASFGHLDWTTTSVMAFASAFLGSVAMWWIYFNIGFEKSSHHISSTDDPGRLARLLYTYVHLLLVAGIIVCAVADEITLSHPDSTAGAAQAAALLGGPALYLFGSLWCKSVVYGRPPLSHMAGLFLLAAIAPVATSVTTLVLGLATTGILVMVAVWETLSLTPKAAS